MKIRSQIQLVMGYVTNYNGYCLLSIVNSKLKLERKSHGANRIEFHLDGVCEQVRRPYAVTPTYDTLNHAHTGARRRVSSQCPGLLMGSACC